MPYFYVKVQKNIDICNFLNGYYCHFYGVRGLFQCPLKWGGLVCPNLESPVDSLLNVVQDLVNQLFREQANCFSSKKSNCFSPFRGDGRGV